MRATVRLHRFRNTWLAGLAGIALALAGCGGFGGLPGPEPASTSTAVNEFQDAPGLQAAILAITGATGDDGTFQVGDKLHVTFSLKKDDGTAWNAGDMNTARILVSGPTFNYQRVIAQQSDVAGKATWNGGGSWTYTFAQGLPANYLEPYNDTASFGTADGELTGQHLVAGTYTVGVYFGWNYTVGAEGFSLGADATGDFLFGGATELVSREVVGADNCNQCHDKLQAHGGTRRSPVLCALCHTAGSEDRNVATAAGGTPGASVDFRVMIHKLHNGAHLPSVLGVATNGDGTRDYAAEPKPYELVGFQNSIHDFSEVNFPAFPNLSSAMPKDLGYSALTTGQKSQEDAIRRGVSNCSKCHGDPDGSGPLAAPAQGGLSETQPGRNSCGSCHDDLDYTKDYTANGATMLANIGFTAACNSCHPVSGTEISVRDAHYHPLENPALNAGVAIAITDIAVDTGGGNGAGGNFLDGDAPRLTFEVTNDAGADVALSDLDAATVILAGPTNGRQIVLPYPGANTISTSPFDFAGRLSPASTAKGSLQKPVRLGAAVAETLVVEFSSATDFTVTGTVSGALGSGALPASPSTNPQNSSLASTVLTTDAVPQTITVAFLDNKSFTVTGSLSGTMSGSPPPSLPSATSGSMRFLSTDGTVAFVLTVGTTQFAAGNSIYMTVFQTGAANPMLLPIVAGRTSFSGAAPAPDRFYLEVIPDGPTYAVTVPMDLTMEYLGEGDGLVDQTLVAGNLPVYYGRQTLSEVTTVDTATTLTADAQAQDRFVDVASTAGYASGNTVVLDSGGGVGTREYVNVGWVENATRLWFATPLRYAHDSGAAVAKATLTFRQEGAANGYTLNSATGAVKSVVAFGSGNGIVMTYRTAGRFGWYRDNLDSLQTFYQPPADDSPDLDEAWGDWKGMHFVDGTYTAALWGSRNIYVGTSGEAQTYRSAAKAATVDFLYGASATDIEPQDIIDLASRCDACHNDTAFHGLSRRSLDSCLMCHQPASEDTPKYSSNSTPATTGVTVDFRTMLHKIHMGADLTNASTYQVNSDTYEDVEFPSMPGGVRNCEKCHGEDNDSWMEPRPRTHPTEQVLPTRVWRAACITCHDSDAAAAHADVQTSVDGSESCEVCHGKDGDFSVERAHKVR